MKIGLIDVDGHRYPNLALMKLSAWHKLQGDSVSMCDPLVRYDRVYASKVFSFTPDFDFRPLTDDLRLGGTGYGVRLDDKLPDEVEHVMPDYGLYGDRFSGTAYGFMSRGCPRGCPFCIVANKEGRASVKVADLREWWNGQPRIELMDPNTLACPDWRDILGQLAESGAFVDINQGADIRLIDEEKAAALNRVKLSGVHFAWDGHVDLEPKFRLWRELSSRKFGGRYATVYVLVNFDSDLEWDLHRIYTLRDLHYDPYVMVYDKAHARPEVIQLQRWCNNKIVFGKCKNFKDYTRSRVVSENPNQLKFF